MSSAIMGSFDGSVLYMFALGRPFLSQELGDENFLGAKFTYYAVRELRQALRTVGTDLVVRWGDAAVEVPRVVRETGASHVFYHRR